MISDCLLTVVYLFFSKGGGCISPFAVIRQDSIVWPLLRRLPTLMHKVAVADGIGYLFRTVRVPRELHSCPGNCAHVFPAGAAVVGFNLPVGQSQLGSGISSNQMVQAAVSESLECARDRFLDTFSNASHSRFA